MRPFVQIVSLAAFASLAAANHDCTEVQTLALLQVAREQMIRGAASYEIAATFDREVELLREPLPEGGYRWVRWVRPPGDAPLIKREHLVSTLFDDRDLAIFEAEASHPFAVRIVVPRKRSLLKPNNEVFVGDVTIRYRVDGETRTLKKRVDAWLAPDTSRTFDLDVIADYAEASVEVGTRQKTLKESLVEVHFKQAVAEDDPQNPNYETIVALKRMRDTLTPATIDFEIARIQRRLYPDASPLPIATLLTRLREAETLVKSSKEEEQEKGRKLLTSIVKDLRY